MSQRDQALHVAEQAAWATAKEWDAACDRAHAVLRRAMEQRAAAWLAWEAAASDAEADVLDEIARRSSEVAP